MIDDRAHALAQRRTTCDYCSAHPRTSFDYVRHYYGVPAARGMRVTVDGQTGCITSGDGGYVRVRFDGHKHAVPCHPTWAMTYHTAEGDQDFGAGVGARPDGAAFRPMHALG
jgi:hypothetical protein